MIIGSSHVEVKELSKAEEITGKLAFQHLDDKLMHSVLDNDKKTIDKGKLLNDAMSYGVGTFTPDLMFEQLTKNYSLAKQIYGESLIRMISGYDGDYIKRNIDVPEFKKELKEAISKKIEELKDDGFLGSDNSLTDKGLEFASLVLYFQELDNLLPSGSEGQKLHKKHSIYGDKQNYSAFKKGVRYRDIAVKNSIKLAIRRYRKSIDVKDLMAFERQSRGRTEIIYALDASGSMKGKKIDACKKAGIALAYKAINNKDKVGIIVFGSDIKMHIEPTIDFTRILKGISSIKATKETDIAATFKKAIEVFSHENITKHLVIITDAMPTKGESPEKDSIDEAFAAKSNGITISVVGINLDDKGRKFAEKIAEIGEGRLYFVKDVDSVDKIVLEDYYSL